MVTNVSFVSLQVFCQFLLLTPLGQLAPGPWLLHRAFISPPPSLLPFPLAPGDLSSPTHSSPPVTHPDPTLQGAPSCCRQSSLGQILPLRLRPPPPLRPEVPCAAHPNYRPPSKEIRRDAVAVTLVSGSRLPASAMAPCLKTHPPCARNCPLLLPPTCLPAKGRRLRHNPSPRPLGAAAAGAFHWPGRGGGARAASPALRRPGAIRRFQRVPPRGSGEPCTGGG